MKFGPVHPRANTDPERYNFAPSDTLIGFAGSHPMLVRGHTLVWHKQISDWVVKGHFDSRALNAILQDHIRTVVSHFGNKVYAWDVVNEAFDDDGTMRSTLWYDQPGIGYAGQGTKYIEKALAWAKAVNPGAKLFYNHYDAEVVNPKSDAIYAMAQGFVRRGVPLNGVGFQMHVDLSFDNPGALSAFTKNLERFAALGLELHITELDVRVNSSDATHLNAQAALYGKIVSACLHNSAGKLVETWASPTSSPGFQNSTRDTVGLCWGIPTTRRSLRMTRSATPLEETQPGTASESLRAGQGIERSSCGTPEPSLWQRLPSR